MDIKDYWKQVNQVAAQLPAEEIWLMSLDEPNKGTKAGVVVCCPRKDAAIRMVEKTHRIATTDEVIASNARQEVHSRKVLAREQTKLARNMPVSPEQFAQLMRGQPIEAQPKPQTKPAA